jgi:hypothetical protein
VPSDNIWVVFRFNIAVMMDTEGSEAHLLALDPLRVEVCSAQRDDYTALQS